MLKCFYYFIMNILHAIILGIIEGVTEFLPISSTAHLEMMSHILRLVQSDFIKSFEISIQLGAILAVVVIYSKLLFQRKRVWKPIIAGFIPTAVIGFILYKIIKDYLLGNSWLVVATLFFGGIIIIWFERWLKKTEGRIESATDSNNDIVGMKLSTAVWIGLAQSLAVVPGVSRSAATIIAGRLLGMRRVAIVEFSFLLAIPTMAAATGYDMIKSVGAFNSEQFWLLAVGFVTAFVSAFFAVHFLLNYVKKNSFAVFGIYRIIIAIAFALFILM